MLKTILLFISSMLIVLVSFSQTLTITTTAADAQVFFGVKKIKEAAYNKKWKIEETVVVGMKYPDLVTVELITDSARAAALIQFNKWKPAKSFGDECYAIRINKR